MAALTRCFLPYCSFHSQETMSFLTSESAVAEPTDNAVGAITLPFDKNALATAGACVAIGTVSVGATVAVAVAPAHMLVGTAVAGTLLYAGDRKEKGLPFFPSFPKSEDGAETATA